MTGVRASARAILIAGAGASVAGVVIPALTFAVFRIAARIFDLYENAFVVAMVLYGLTGFLLFMGIGVSAGHLAARFDRERPRVSAVIATTCVLALFMAIYIQWTGDVSLLGMLTVSTIAISVAAIVAGHGARRACSRET